MRSKSPALKFTKMHALGNDFVVIDAITQEVNMTAVRAKKLADRYQGIGCDQILLVEPPSNPDVDFNYRIFNQDGSEVSQCGNGARCFAKYVRDRKLTGKDRISVETRAGLMELSINTDRTYSVALGVPDFALDQVPYMAESASSGTKQSLNIGDESFEFFALSIGNPHAVILVESIEDAEVERIGALLQEHASFPESVNVSFMEIISRTEIQLRVFERGVGETFACGSGACAAVAAGINNDLLDSATTVNLPLGKLTIEWLGAGHPAVLTGPATTVFQGHTRL
mgnify:CR=1 FL=1